MAFQKNNSSRFSSAKPDNESSGFLSKITKKPLLLVGIAAALPVLFLIAFTFKSGYSPSKKTGSKYDKIVVTKTPIELADEATELLRKRDTAGFLDLLDREIASDVNIVNSKGDTLLMVAATLNNEEAVRELLMAGADVNKTNAFTKDTALLRSLYYADNVDIARQLVYSGADINIRNNYDHSPLFLALEKQKGELIDLFLSSGVREGLSGDYLFRASAKKNYMGVLAMLKGGIDPNIRNEKGNTPLIISSSLGDLPSVRALLAYRADINAANNDGNTSLIYASRYNHPAVVKELLTPQTLQAPIDVNAQNKAGQTALYWAAAKGNEAIVRRLLAENADPTLAAKDGLVPYRVAQKNNQNAVLPWFEKNLVEVKNSVIAEDNEALKAQAKAEGRELPDFTPKEGPVTDKDIFKAAESGNVDLAKRVIDQNKAVVFDKNKEGQTPLLVAVENGHTGMVDLLIDNMARLYESSNKGNVFHLAVLRQNMDMLKHLVNLARQEGRLSMMLEYKAFLPQEKAATEKIQFPLTPLGFAAFDCNKEFYDYLISLGAKPGKLSGKDNLLQVAPSPADLMNRCSTKKVTAKKLTSKKK